MSQPQPAPYYQPQPPKKSSAGLIILIVVLVVALVAGVGGYAGYQLYQASLRSGSSGGTITISGNSSTETVNVNSDSTVEMSCNYCTVTLQLGAPSVTADLNISGNYNHVTIIGGKTNILVSGNYNSVNAQQTVILSTQKDGTGNTIQG